MTNAGETDRGKRLGAYSGCLLGLAVGDALGTTLEFRSPGTFAPISDIEGGGPFGLKAGEWTDDTSMALCLADSLVERGEFDPRDQMERYLKWRDHGYLSSNGRCFDIGNTVARALRHFEETGDPYSGSTDPHTAGNGSLMRLAPVPMRYASDPAVAITLSGESSRTTHGARTAIDACRYMGALILGALYGEEKDRILSDSYSPVPGYWREYPPDPEVEQIMAGSFKRLEPPEIKGSGYVVRSLEAALWALHRSGSFREAVLLAANLGDDADTTAAVCGQLAGAYYGLESAENTQGIPAAWLNKLAHRDLIDGFARKLYALAWGAES